MTLDNDFFAYFTEKWPVGLNVLDGLYNLKVVDCVPEDLVGWWRTGLVTKVWMGWRERRGRKATTTCYTDERFFFGLTRKISIILDRYVTPWSSSRQIERALIFTATK